MNLPDEAPARVGPENRRITWMILTFVALSLAASVLPLWPDVRRYVPLGFLDRRHGLAVYGVSLLGFMLLGFPLFVRLGAGTLRPWWFLGGMVAAFAGVPLFVLAYIAGVHLHGVIAILLWAGILHGLALAGLRFLRHRRAWIVVPGFLWLAVVPTLSAWRTALEDRDRGALLFSPTDEVIRIAVDFARPDLVPLAAAVVVLYLIALLPRRRRVAGMIASSVLAVMLSAASPSASVDPRESSPATRNLVQDSPSDDVRVRPLLRDRFVPGMPWPILVDLGAQIDEVIVDVAGRERYRITAADNPSRRVWIYPSLIDPSDTVIVSDSDEKERARFDAGTSRPVASLVLEITNGTSIVPAETWTQRGVVAVAASPNRLPSHMLGYRSFGSVVMTADQWAKLDADDRERIEGFAESGGGVVLLDAKTDTRRGFVRRVHGRELPDDFASMTTPSTLPSPIAATPASGLEANLYASFALPDWGRVDLTRLIVFLVVYHGVFLLIFLLPILLDAKKSRTVYLVSVGSCLAVVIVAAYLTLNAIFLREMQILQQSVAIHVLRDGGDVNGEVGNDASVIVTDEMTCFASFNAQSGVIRLDRRDAAMLLHESTTTGAGSIRVDDDGAALELERVPLDRAGRKLVVRHSAVAPIPFDVVRSGDRIRLRPKPGVADPRGLLTARRLGAFVRRVGRLYRVVIEDGALVVASQPARGGLSAMLPESLVTDGGISFVRYLLGRFVPRDEAILVVMLEGTTPLHHDDGYLWYHDIGQLMVLPLRDG